MTTSKKEILATMVRAAVDVDEQEKRAQALEREARAVALTGKFVSGKHRNELRHPRGRARVETITGGQEAPPNAPCPCGSGKKYKRCCRARGTRYVVRPNVGKAAANAATSQAKEKA